MSDSDKVFAGSVPEIYDTHLVPLIFESYADDLARRVAALKPARVLEIAAGTGVVSRALAPLLPPTANYVVTDLNQPMLDRARARQPADALLEWRQADAMALPFNDESFDAIACQFGVMFLPDRTAGYAEARRALRPGGSFVFNSWDRIEANEFAHAVTDALAAVFLDDPPRFMARTPHGYHDVDRIRRDVEVAGFSDVSVETVEARSVATTPEIPAIAYCQGTPLRGEIEARDAARLKEATVRATEAIAARFGPGPVDGRIRAHIVTAIR